MKPWILTRINIPELVLTCDFVKSEKNYDPNVQKSQIITLWKIDSKYFNLASRIDQNNHILLTYSQINKRVWIWYNSNLNITQAKLMLTTCLEFLTRLQPSRIIMHMIYKQYYKIIGPLGFLSTRKIKEKARNKN